MSVWCYILIKVCHCTIQHVKFRSVESLCETERAIDEFIAPSCGVKSTVRNTPHTNMTDMLWSWIIGPNTLAVCMCLHVYPSPSGCIERKISLLKAQLTGKEWVSCLKGHYVVQSQNSDIHNIN